MMQNNSKIAGNKSKLIGGAITAFVLVLLVLAGPANALNLSLSEINGKNPVVLGTEATTTGKITVNSNEVLEQDSLVQLNIDGPGKKNDRVCVFELDGTLVSGCEGITIELKSQTATNYGYGYGYGYSNGDFEYEITIDTSDFHYGSYKVELKTGETKSDYQIFVVSAKGKNK